MKKLVCLCALLFWFTAPGQSAGADSVRVYRERVNAQFSHPDTSPIPKDELLHFTGLSFFDFDSAYVVKARLKRIKKAKPFAMKTTTDREPLYRLFGVAEFTIAGKNLKLNIYQNLDLITRPGFRDYLFLPFSDLTSGNQTYIGGRYLDLKIPDGDWIEIDFNKAYNPYCAYNPQYSCPLVPLENDLPVEINAGVQKYHD
jgi:uncharacterized protein